MFAFIESRKREVTKMILSQNARRWVRVIAGTGLLTSLFAIGYCWYLAQWPQTLLMMIGAVTFGLALRVSRQ